MQNNVVYTEIGQQSNFDSTLSPQTQQAMQTSRALRACPYHPVRSHRHQQPASCQLRNAKSAAGRRQTVWKTHDGQCRGLGQVCQAAATQDQKDAALDAAREEFSDPDKRSAAEEVISAKFIVQSSALEPVQRQTSTDSGCPAPLARSLGTTRKLQSPLQEYMTRMRQIRTKMLRDREVLERLLDALRIDETPEEEEEEDEEDEQTMADRVS